ncbi:hypothetical protein RJ641_019277 [Dillenia turbinata]|uniref:Uncharacterized protein n=1 Tax=Dillenia turbinata TaxID=194707 RepID=A0AAN8UR32_9MAGN
MNHLLQQLSLLSLQALLLSSSFPQTLPPPLLLSPPLLSPLFSRYHPQVSPIV